MNNVAVVVVTYNRLNELKKCILSLRNQTYKEFDIIVVNNGSTDNTKEYLDVETGLIIIHQSNMGGAGGFYSGMKYMYENRYEWLWMMDDDGIADENQLNSLLSFSARYGKKFLNALVVDKDNHNELAFSINNKYSLFEYSDKECIEGKISPFNGTFIHRDIIKTVGFVKKEMFIWGDEQEYTKRIKRAGFIPFTVINAIHYHPKEKGVMDIVLPGIINDKILIKPHRMSHYYYRNIAYINHEYGDHFYTGVGIYFRYVIYFIRKFQIKELLKFVKYYYRGSRNIFNN